MRPLNESFGVLGHWLTNGAEDASTIFARGGTGKSMSLHVRYLRPNHSVAMPRNEKNPTTSVTVVTNTPDDIAGSARK
jgi:hypothetical protein